MFKNYLKTAFRNIIRNKVSSVINITGLAIGIASCILIFLYVQNELSYDKHHKNAGRIFRITTDFTLSGQFDRFALSSFMLAPTLKEDYAEIDEATRIMPIGKQTVWYEDKMYNEEKVYYADSNHFDVFSYEFLKGDQKNALNKPRSIVLSEAMAQKYFGNENPIGKNLKFTKNTFTVTGVIKDNGNRSHINPNALLSISTLDSNFINSVKVDWFRMTTYTYIMFKDATQRNGFENKLKQFYKEHIEPFTKEYNVSSSIDLKLQPLKEIHLSSSHLYDLEENGNASYVYIFSFVAFFILLIACINYMNMATAHASKRAKEVGIRKVLGASRKQLLWQFLGESILITLFALSIALVMVELFLPVFNALTGINFKSDYLANIRFLPLLIFIVVLVGLLGGSYPAIFLSAFKPLDVLKSQKAPRGGSALLRKSLVVIQFAISTALVVGTLIVWSQMDFMKNKDLGFNKEQVLALRIPGGDTSLARKIPMIKEELLRNAKVKKVAVSGGIPGESTGRLLFFVTKEGKKEEKAMPFMFVDYDYLDMLELQIAKGRNFSRDYQTDKMNAFLINEAAAKFLGFKEPLGQELENGFGFKGKVVGLVKDFHYASLHKEIEPLILMLAPQPGGFLLSKIAPDNISSTVGFIENKWKEFDPKHPVEYFFLDQNFDQQYRKEEKMLTIFGYFSGLTIFIACLGLFGLASYTAEQRTKEIGIRKVNGASLQDITFLFVKDFIKLVAIALIIAWPLSWYVMHRWLEDFAYRIEITPLSFIIAGILALAIALITVSFHAIRSARTNPVKSLRYE